MKALCDPLAQYQWQGKGVMTVKCFHYEKMPVQHAIYGPSAPIALELTPDNWEECAILRSKQYVYIGVGCWGGTDDDSSRYRVDASPDNSLSSDFENLEEAIDYANNLGQPNKELPFNPSSGVYAGVKFGEVREGVPIPSLGTVNDPKEDQHG